MKPRDFVIATGNSGKIRELHRIFAGLPFNLHPQTEYFTENAEENGTDYVQNALIKAYFAYERTLLPCIADDSGIEVPAINSRPGVHSASFAGPQASASDNRKHLLKMMLPFTDTGKRNACFVCTAVCVLNIDTPPIVCTATWNGYITHQEGGEGGFGYDAIFYVPAFDCTVAQLDPSIKNEYSHRAKAFARLSEMLTTTQNHTVQKVDIEKGKIKSKLTLNQSRFS